ncbi:MAG: polysaccharide biosynthesis/export family protein [Phycisphaerales bacterium]
MHWKTARSLLLAILITGAAQLFGCEVDSFFDPSKTGRFEPTATMIPILERLDVIEQEEDPFAAATQVTPADLLPSDLEYRLTAGDIITVEVLDLIQPGQLTVSTRAIGAAGMFRLPVIGDIPAAGLTAQEFQDHLFRLIHETVVLNPVVNVVVEQGGGFSYTLYGAVGTGMYALRRADFRLMDALSLAGGVLPSTQQIYVIRQVPLSGEVEFAPGRRDDDQAPSDREPPVDVDTLIEQMQRGDKNGVNPGLLPQDAQPLVDIDQLEPVRISDRPVVDVEELSTRRQPPLGDPQSGDTFIYDQERGEWVRVRSDEAGGPAQEGPAGQPPLFAARIIEIPYPKLKTGDSSYNIVVRPDDRIYVEEPLQGLVYIEGEIFRPGAYSLPRIGRLTLSRLVASAGGPGPLAITERVDLTRMVGRNLEATVRLNLGAIRQRTEPDVFLKPMDHIIIGTSWIATPLAIFRNGFRVTYGFGFLLDRNFGNDVFGAPPVNFRNAN